MAENDSLLTITSAAEKLGISPATLRKWDTEGKLKPIRIGSRGDRRYRLEDIQTLQREGQSKWSPIDMEKFQKWLNKGNFWMEEATFQFLLADLPVRQMAQIDQWLSPGLEFCLFTFESGYMHQILDIDESIACCQAYVNAWQKNPEKIEEIFSEWKAREKKVDAVMGRLDFLDLRHLSNEKLLEEFNRFNDVTEAYWAISLILEPYSPYLDMVLYPRFEKWVKDPKKAKEAFATLALPLESSFIAEERKDLLRIAIAHLHSPEERKKFYRENVEDYLADIRKTTPLFFEALLRHQQNYYWMQNSFSDWKVLTINDFVHFLRDTIKGMNTQTMKEELGRMENAEEIRKAQEKYIRELKIPAEMENELKYIRRITWVKDDRKREVLQNNHHYFRFIHEFARRSNVDVRILGNAFVSEVPAILSQSYPLEKIEKRRNLVWVSQKGYRVSALIENEAQMVLEKVLTQKETSHIVEIHGMVASRGNDSILNGKVKVILNPKDQTIQPDEILVTSMTRPEFLPLMKIAKGFITNEGGVTCHAAIVAREMNKPCIIGTAHATKVLQTGDEVEMRMNHGIVFIKKRGHIIGEGEK